MEKVVIGVVHLLPLPGSPMYEDFERVIERAVEDARTMEEGGCDAIIVENYGDMPFKREVGKEVVACMTAVAREIKDEISIGLGINVLRNDGFAAIAIAKAVKADFVRINQLFFPSFAPEGILEGSAGDLMRYKRYIDCRAMIFADIAVKHAVHPVKLEDYCLNAERNLIDAVIVTGKVTGGEVSLRDLKYVREKVRIPVLAGSGVNGENVEKIIKYCDGVIVGSYIRRKGKVDVGRVRKIVEGVKGKTL